VTGGGIPLSADAMDIAGANSETCSASIRIKEPNRSGNHLSRRADT
jgi:hypothetical protein